MENTELVKKRTQTQILTTPIRTRPRRVSHVLMSVLLSLALMTLASIPGTSASRIKDLVTIEGVRDNQLIGYGLIVGLNGTGDTLGNSPFTRQSLQSMLERLGVNTRGAALRTANLAAVIVTSTLHAFASQGNRIDISVSALGDATSLRGGTLLATPLLGADGEVYAVAQGSVASAGFSAEGDGASLTRGVPTSGRVANGAIVEREISYTLASQTNLRLSLRNPDFTTARRIASAVNIFLGTSVATATNNATVQLVNPRSNSGDMVELLAGIEQLLIEPDIPARVVIDERSGIIVLGSNVRLSEVAIAQGNLTISITENPIVSQPNPLSSGQTVELPRTTITESSNGDARLARLERGITLQELVDGLNSLGVGPQDLIAILHAIKAAGALHAEIEIL